MGQFVSSRQLRLVKYICYAITLSSSARLAMLAFMGVPQGMWTMQANALVILISAAASQIVDVLIDRAKYKELAREVLGDGTIESWQESKLYFRATRATADKWLVWCSYEPLKANHPIHEDQDQKLWFQFCATKEEGVEQLKAELSQLQGFQSE